MDKETGFPEVGDTLTIANQIFTIGGQIIHEAGDKVVVREVSIREGHPYRTIPDIWIPPQLRSIKLVGHYGIDYLPDTFEETKQFSSRNKT
jgi:hypothetical protein